MKGNLKTIDILRGFAASMVFFYHYGLTRTINKIIHSNIPDIIEIIGSTYAVPLFFLISGFCIHLSQLKLNEKTKTDKLDLANYFNRRFWRIYPCYLIILLMACSFHSISGEKVDVLDFIFHVFILQGLTVKYFNSINLVLWTITTEILFYCLYPIWYSIRNKIGIHWALVISLLVSIFSWTVVGLEFNCELKPVRLFILNIWVGWCFGAWLCEEVVLNKKRLDKNIYWWVAGGILFVLNYLIGSVSRFQFATANISIVLWAWVIVPFLRLETTIDKFKENGLAYFVIKILISIGLSSFSLYLIHEPLMNFRNAILANINSEKLRLLLGAGWLIFTFIVAWFSYELFEKPFLKYRKV